jgi:triphosphatase
LQQIKTLLCSRAKAKRTASVQKKAYHALTFNYWKKLTIMKNQRIPSARLHLAPAPQALPDSATMAPDAPRRAGRVALPKHATVEQGMRRIFAACLDHARANAQGFLASDDPEFLHQLRVGLRRFKSALKLFRGVAALPPPLQQSFDDVSALLGAARGADVLLLTTLPGIAKAGRHAALLQPLVDHVQADAQEKRAAARAGLQAEEQGMQALHAWVAGKQWRGDMSRAGRARLRKPLSGYARQAIAHAHAVVAKRARKVHKLGGHDSASLHRLRIGAKQARYAVGFFADIERPAKAARYAKRLAAVQEALGALNDAHVAQTLLTGFTASHPGLAPAAGVVAAYLDGMAAARLNATRAPWRGLAGEKAARSAHGLVRGH